MNTIDKYFARNSAPEFPLTDAPLNCAVIPAYDEMAELPQALQTIEVSRKNFAEPLAILVVVNHPKGVSAESSLAMLNYLKSPENPVKNLAVLYLPELIGGVGKARKIGMDSYLAAVNKQGISPEKAKIFSLDADTWIEPNYFTVTARALDTADTVVIGVRHRDGATAEEERAIRAYEKYILRHAAKLRAAGSPYGFHTIGSAFAVTGRGYLRAGGMKVREAGEDFYFLQEAAKTGVLRVVEEQLAHPSPRISHRVPFGTGVAVRDLLQGKPLAETPDHAFEELEKLLNTATQTGVLSSAANLRGLLTPIARNFLQKEKFFTLWDKIVANQPDTDTAKIKAFHRWFDGLKTLRFLHFCTDIATENNREDNTK